MDRRAVDLEIAPGQHDESFLQEKALRRFACYAVEALNATPAGDRFGFILEQGRNADPGRLLGAIEKIDMPVALQIDEGERLVLTIDGDEPPSAVFYQFLAAHRRQATP